MDPKLDDFYSARGLGGPGAPLPEFMAAEQPARCGLPPDFAARVEAGKLAVAECRSLYPDFSKGSARTLERALDWLAFLTADNSPESNDEQG